MADNDSKFSSGFLLGLLIGGGIVFLFGTKTGKRLLKTLSEQGLEGVTNFVEEQLGEREEESDFEEEVVENNGFEEPSAEIKKAKPRFFRRSPKVN